MDLVSAAVNGSDYPSALFSCWGVILSILPRSGEVTNEERATFDKERNLLYQQLDEKDGEINNQSQLISRLQVEPHLDV